MSFDFIKYREQENLNTVLIKNKESYYNDLFNIEHSTTGRLDAQIANIFLSEAVQLIINAIKLFELGYFDCAYYSLRQSLEVSTTMIYLTDIDYQLKNKEFEKWKKEKSFPMYGQMLKFLDKQKGIFTDLKLELKEYFEQVDITKNKLNKYVHKQGFDKLYTSLHNAFGKKKSNTKICTEFENHLKTCIGAIGVFRLAIDPFPILLREEEIYYRTGDLLTKPYTDDFIEKYIGVETIEKYKKSEFYKNHYNHIMTEERQLECISNLIKHQYIDTNEIENILEQSHLLKESDISAIKLVKGSKEITKVYTYGGLLWYFTDRNTLRKSQSWSSEDFKGFLQAKDHSNLPYGEAFITIIEIGKEPYFLEHNKKLSKKEIDKLKTCIKEPL